MPRRRSFEPHLRTPPSAKEPVQVHLRQPPLDGVVRWHRHVWGQFAFPRRGSIRITAAGTTWTIPPSRGVWVPPGVEHELQMLGRVEFYVLYVEPSALPLEQCEMMEISPLIHSLGESLAQESRMSVQRRRQLMSQLVLEEIGAAPKLSFGLRLPEDRRLRSLCEAMIGHPGSERTLAQWAPLIGASARTLARLFQTELHTSFSMWRRQLRLARAVDLLDEGSSVENIAADLGYANASAFCTMFKRELGFPPSQLEKHRRRQGIGRPA